jgi:hypothetical protein
MESRLRLSGLFAIDALSSLAATIVNTSVRTALHAMAIMAPRHTAQARFSGGRRSGIIRLEQI